MRYLNVKGLIDYTTLSRPTIYRHIKENTIPSIKIGRRRLFDRNEIDNWIRSGYGFNDELPTIQGI